MLLTIVWRCGLISMGCSEIDRGDHLRSLKIGVRGENWSCSIVTGPSNPEAAVREAHSNGRTESTSPQPLKTALSGAPDASQASDKPAASPPNSLPGVKNQPSITHFLTVQRSEPPLSQRYDPSCTLVHSLVLDACKAARTCNWALILATHLGCLVSNMRRITLLHS